jgi:hypothetical protein
MIAAVPEEHRALLLPQLRAKPVRTASGIAVVAVMSKPHRCPHIATTGEPVAVAVGRVEVLHGCACSVVVVLWCLLHQYVAQATVAVELVVEVLCMSAQLFPPQVRWRQWQWLLGD